MSDMKGKTPTLPNSMWWARDKSKPSIYGGSIERSKNFDRHCPGYEPEGK